MKPVKLFSHDISICRHFGYRIEVQKQKTSYAVYVLEQYDDDPNAPFGDGVGAGLSEHYIFKEMDKQKDYLAGFFQGLYTGNAIMKNHYYSIGLKPYLTKIRNADTANHVAKTLDTIMQDCINRASLNYYEANPPAK